MFDSRNWTPRLASRALFLLAVPVSCSWQAAPLSQYKSVPLPEAQGGVRRFQHAEEHQFDDGGRVALRWEVDVDPDTILSLDVEHSSGVRVLECKRDGLVLQVPEAHLARANTWSHVVASDYLHGCPHLLIGKHLYHRVLEVNSVKPQVAPQRGAVVSLATQEVDSPAHVFRRIDLSFSFTPANVEGQSPMRSPSSRRMQGWDVGGADMSMDVTSSSDGLPPTTEQTWREAVQGSATSGMPNFGSDFSSTEDVQSMLNIGNPDQISTLQWNWDKNIDSAKNEEFEFEFPGGESWLRLYKPYFVARVGLSVNYTTHETSVFEQPNVHIVSRLKGNAEFNADVATSADFEESTAVDPMQNFTVPFIAREESALQPIKMFLGNTPFQINPGFTCHLNAYHVGELQGSLRFGIKANVDVDSLMTFDTTTGVVRNTTAQAKDVRVIPPTWMIFTRHFELGLMLEPELWLSGDLGVMRNMKLGMGFRPYMNVTVMQQGEDAVIAPASLSINNLVLYPYRIVGMPVGSLCSVRIRANSWMRQTSMQMSQSSGIVEFSDDIKHFTFASISGTALATAPIEVSIWRDGQQEPVAVATTMCGAATHGECSPSPMHVSLTVEGRRVTVDIATAWRTDPVDYVAGEIVGLDVSVPSMTLSQIAAEHVANGSAIEFRVIRDGAVYVLPLTPEGVMELSSTTPQHLTGARTLDVSLRSGTITDSQLQLSVDGMILGQGFLPAGTLMGKAIEDSQGHFELVDPTTKDVVASGTYVVKPKRLGKQNSGRLLPRKLKDVRWSAASQDHRLRWEGQGESSQSDFAKHMAANADKCDEKPLRYSLGVGVLEKTAVENPFLNEVEGVVMGDGLGQSDQTPATLNGGYTSILHETFASSLAKLLPGAACMGGLCSGELPGCKPQMVEPIDIPKIRIKTSRVLEINELVKPEMRRALAYGLAVVPDSIQIGELAEEGLEKDVDNAFKLDGALRRLEGIETDTLVVQVSKPMIYKMDRELLLKLVSAGSFNLLSDGREKTHGPVSILSAHLEYPRSSSLFQSAVLVPVVCIASMSFAALGALSFLRRRRIRRHQYVSAYDPISNDFE